MQSNEPPISHNPAFWDAQIAALLIIPPLAAAWIIDSLQHPIGWIIGGMLTSGSILVAYGSYIASRRIKVNKKSIQISALPEAKIAVISDFHVGPYKRAGYLSKVVKRVNKLKPDIILMPGDFIFDHYADLTELAPLKELHATFGVCASMGNHDTGSHIKFASGEKFSTVDRSNDVTDALRKMGITVLRDESMQIVMNGKTIALAAIDGAWADRMRVREAMKEIPSDIPAILLAHNPDVTLVPGHEKAALIVSGHTHGGQIRLPFFGALHVPAETKKKYDQGIFILKNKTVLAVTHGIGETMARARLFCPPEILLLENQAGSKNYSL